MKNFDKSKINFIVTAVPGLSLRAVGLQDLELIRKWKNEQRQFFFYQNEISSDQQIKWYESFSQRPYDLMLATIYENQMFGCMGIRQDVENWDVYNVILGLGEFGGRGLMAQAFNALLNYAESIKAAPITLKVLKDNPAVTWYQRSGFKIIETHQNHFLMLHQKN